uniref:Vacuolar protein sorting-associated protein 51 homolog n=1 Tax=Timema monikensis TaxID=170555 RepID=A0A7R9EHJ5_9NEOP|nr:unnamed protein product [Timema monikensis]
MQDGQYAQAVQEYIHARRVLHHYSNMPSFQGIQADCEAIVEELKLKLREQFKSKDATAKELAESVELLLQLKEPASSLCAEFLSHASTRLTEQLASLQSMNNQDIMEFVDQGSSGFLSDLCLVVASYNDMFIKRPRGAMETEDSEDLDNFATSQLNSFVFGNMERYFQLVQDRIEKEQNGGDTAVLVRALDRFHRRLQAMNTLFTHSDFARTGTDIVLRAGRRQCRFHLQTLKIYFSDTLSRVRQTLAAPKLISQDGDSSSSLSELLTSLVLATVEKVKGILQDLLLFSQPDLTFGLKPHFREGFCIDNVREELVVGFFHHLTATARSFCNIGENKAPPALLLLLSKMCLEFEGSSVHYLLSQTDEWFNIEDRSKSGILTTEEEICSNMRAAAQELLNHYVRTQGLGVSQKPYECNYCKKPGHKAANCWTKMSNEKQVSLASDQIHTAAEEIVTLSSLSGNAICVDNRSKYMCCDKSSFFELMPTIGTVGYPKPWNCLRKRKLLEFHTVPTPLVNPSNAVGDHVSAPVVTGVDVRGSRTRVGARYDNSVTQQYTERNPISNPAHDGVSIPDQLCPLPELRANRS